MRTGMRVAVAVVVAVLALGAAGCTGGDGDPDQEESEPCFDLECETTVMQGEEIAADGAHGITRVTFPRIGSDGMKIVFTGPGYGRQVCESRGNVLSACDSPPVTIDVTDVTGNTAAVSITS
ncbi:hypothetical protein [Streptomyces sp. 6N223]|uniref:hypothetical protein n=1 Tax=Streptomyces sp. 6N223 TaxID=3457412 RepID=UPI003FD080C4